MYACMYLTGTKSPYKIGDMNKRLIINKLNGRNKKEITKLARNTNRYREIQRGGLILHVFAYPETGTTVKQDTP